MSADTDLARLAQLAECGQRTKSGSVTLPNDLLAPQVPLPILSGIPPWTRAIWVGVERSNTPGMVVFRLRGNKGQVAYNRTFQLGSGGSVGIDAGAMCGTILEVLSHFQAQGESQLPAVTWVCAEAPLISAEYSKAFLQQTAVAPAIQYTVPDGADEVQLTQNLVSFTWQLQTTAGAFAGVTGQTSAGDVLARQGDLFQIGAGSPVTTLVWRIRL